MNINVFTIIVGSFMVGVYVTVFIIDKVLRNREKTNAEKLQDEIDDGDAW